MFAILASNLDFYTLLQNSVRDNFLKTAWDNSLERKLKIILKEALSAALNNSLVKSLERSLGIENKEKARSLAPFTKN